jgi:DNA repair exonuclease SbcCD ATPase subunit
MKTNFFSFFGIAMILISSCKNDQQVEAKCANTKETAAELDSVIALVKIKDSLIASFFNSFSEIENNLTTIQHKENLLSNKPKNFEALNGNVKNSINEEISSINALLEKNHKEIIDLNNKLHKSQIKANGLDKMIATLNTQLQDKTQELEKLYDYLATKNSTISKLNTSIVSLIDQGVLQSDVIHEQDKLLNKAYYLSGNYKELKAKNLVNKKGGFLGLGKEKTLKPDFDAHDFTPIDIRQTTSITILSKKVKLLTNHPTTSYELKHNDERLITDLVITDPENFWKESKYLVVMVN